MPTIYYLVDVETAQVGNPAYTNTAQGLVSGRFQWATGDSLRTFDATNYYPGHLDIDGVGTPSREVDISEGGAVAAGCTARLAVSNTLDLHGFLLDNSLYLEGRLVRIFKGIGTADPVLVWSGVVTEVDSTPGAVAVSGASELQALLKSIPRRAGDLVTIGSPVEATTTGLEVSTEVYPRLHLQATGPGAPHYSEFARILELLPPNIGAIFDPRLVLDVGASPILAGELAGKWVEVVEGPLRGWRGPILGHAAASSGRLTLSLYAWPWLGTYAGEWSLWMPKGGDFPTPVEEHRGFGWAGTIQAQPTTDILDGDPPTREIRHWPPRLGAKETYFEEQLPLPSTVPGELGVVRVLEPQATLRLGDASISSVDTLAGFPLAGTGIEYLPTDNSLRVPAGLVVADDEVRVPEGLLRQALVEDTLPLDVTVVECSTHRMDGYTDGGVRHYGDGRGPNAVIEKGGTGVENNYLTNNWGQLTSPTLRDYTPLPMTINQQFPIWVRLQTGEGSEKYAGRFGARYHLRIAPRDIPEGETLGQWLAGRYDELRANLHGKLEVLFPKAWLGAIPSEGTTLAQAGVAAVQVRVTLYRETASGHLVLLDTQQAEPANLSGLDGPVTWEDRDGVRYCRKTMELSLVDPQYFPTVYPDAMLSSDLRDAASALDLGSLLDDKVEDLAAYQVAVQVDFTVSNAGGFIFAGPITSAPWAFWNWTLGTFEMVGYKSARAGDTLAWGGTSGATGVSAVSQVVRYLLETYDELDPARIAPDDFGPEYGEPEVAAVLETRQPSLAVYQQLVALGDYALLVRADRSLALRRWLGDRDGATPLHTFTADNILRCDGIQQGPISEIFTEVEVQAGWDGSKYTIEAHLDGSLPGPFPAATDRAGPTYYTPLALSEVYQDGAAARVRITWPAAGGATAVGDYLGPVDIGSYLGVEGTVVSVGLNGTGYPVVVLDWSALWAGAASDPALSWTWKKGTPLWLDYVQGVEDYATARELWGRLARAYARNPLTKLGSVETRYLRTQEDVVKLLQYMTRWNTWRKSTVPLVVPLDGTNYELLDYVTVQDEIYTSGLERPGWIVRIAHPSSEAVVELDICLDIDPRELCPDVIIDEGDGVLDIAEWSDISEGDGVIDPLEYEDIDEEFDFDCTR